MYRPPLNAAAALGFRRWVKYLLGYLHCTVNGK